MLVISIFSFSHNDFKYYFLMVVKTGIVWERINSLPNDKILDVIKLKAFADDKINVAQMMIPVFDRVENIVGKGEHAVYQHFLLFPQCFQRVLSWG